MATAVEKNDETFIPNKVVPLRRPWRTVASVLVSIFLALLAWSFLTNPRYAWPIIAEYMFSEPILRGLALTISLTAISMVLGSLGGFFLALMRLSNSPLLRIVSGVYIWLFRGTPLLVLVIILYNISYLYPSFTISLPGVGTLVDADINTLISPTIAAIIAFSMNEAAFMCEVFRGGLLSVGKGQSEAAQALGMRQSQLLRRIVVPQAMKFVLPPTGNQVISLLKATSLVSVISSYDLLYSAQAIYAENYQTLPLLFVAAIWYLILTSILSLVQQKIEKKFGRGASSIAN